jgi:two-component system sensor histidine kinase SenX3
MRTRRGERSRHAPGAPAASVLTPDVERLLGSLRSWWVVVGPGNSVVDASPSAAAYGLIRADRLAVPELVKLARAARSDGRIHDADIVLRRGGKVDDLLLEVRVAPMGGDLLLLLADDRTDSRRVDAVRRDFIANVSHELKTPVGALSLLAEAVLGSSDDPDAVRRFAGRMQHEATRLTQLVQDLISLSRLQGDDPLLEPKLVSVDEVVSEAVDGTILEAQARDIDLVAGGQHGLHLLGDRDQLATAVRNLVANAINYSPDRTRVAIGVRLDGDIVEINVTDQGIGIPERDLERIFERFYRVDPARSRITGGTGLGLAIVKHVCAKHGGEVSVWSIEGSGSTFSIRLPAQEASKSADAEPRRVSR